MTEIRIDEERRRFVADTEAGAAFVEYQLMHDVLTLTHTEVPKAVTGTGVGSALVAWVLDHARAQGQQVVPLCPYVAAYIRRHPAYADLVLPTFRYMVR